MPPQPKNMNELMEYLSRLEQRIETLEQENLYLAKRAPERMLPVTNLLSQKFLSRAFAIWGHFMTANIIIGIPLTIIFYCGVYLFLGSLFSGTTNTPTPTPTYPFPNWFSTPAP